MCAVVWRVCARRAPRSAIPRSPRSMPHLATGDGIMLLMCASSKQQAFFYFSSQLKQIESGPKYAPHCGIVRAAFSIRNGPKKTELRLATLNQLSRRPLALPLASGPRVRSPDRREYA